MALQQSTEHSSGRDDVQSAAQMHIDILGFIYNMHNLPQE